ncbi:MULTISPECIES: tyrosine-type recombinase/integrase [unclassified Streptomyces]|uniref:tyrosine-type recombinase/integrase n=1 Tax=unclassified Streptomyces TaxID=2593676 RepID=UPI001BEA5848|nr:MULTISPECIES: tyrosine-type recombinase/integrase [unclassified Streptomyces]MBT2403671.1 tyrosine-type recombinase/integrase [Streptomyces sp. ISL-21]MBT2611272.1 tyrosine-type recombinase/integrase [Streptomyces sp. ISL-87]
MTRPDALTAGPGHHPFTDLDILQAAGYRTRPGTRRPRFDQDTWDLTCVAEAPVSWPRSQQIVDFTQISNPIWRAVARTYLMGRLLPTHPAVCVLPQAYRTPLALQTLRHEVVRLTAWFNHLTDAGLTELKQIRQRHCDTYLSAVSVGRTDPSKPVTPGTVAGFVLTAQALASYAPLLQDSYPTGFRPWGDRTASQVAGYQRPDINQTPAVPDDILRPLLAGASYLVHTIGPHLVKETARAREITDHRGGIRSSLRVEHHPLVIAEIERRIAAGIPAPRAAPAGISRRLTSGWDADDPLLTLAYTSFTKDFLSLSSTKRDLDRLRPHMEAWVAACGIENSWCRNASVVPRANDETPAPWALPMNHFALDSTIFAVTSAAYYLTAALSGMRASELAELTHGCRRCEDRTYGSRHWLDSRRIKGEKFGGVPDSWVVIEDVHHAVAIAEALSNTDPGNLIFPGANNSSNRYTALRDWINGPFGQHLGLTKIPDGPVHPRALRRTLALAIAQRPHGLLAAKWHLKHVSVATTEGYTARPGGHQAAFLAEVQTAEEVEHTRLTVSAYHDYQEGTLPSGRGARGLIAAFQNVDRSLVGHDPGPATVADDRRVEKLLKTKAKTLHIGVANYCWFTDPAKALCLTMAGTPNATEPLMGMCDSAHCPQATHHPQHRQAWADHAENTRAVFLGNPRLSAPERQRAQQTYERSMRIVESIDTAVAGEETSSAQ